MTGFRQNKSLTQITLASEGWGFPIWIEAIRYFSKKRIYSGFSSKEIPS